jgi:hypothetical protein
MADYLGKRTPMFTKSAPPGRLGEKTNYCAQKLPLSVTTTTTTTTAYRASREANEPASGTAGARGGRENKCR